MDHKGNDDDFIRENVEYAKVVAELASSKLWKWHQRFGNLNGNDLLKLVKNSVCELVTRKTFHSFLVVKYVQRER